MKKLIFILAILLVVSTKYTKGQNQLGKSDDLARISLTPIVPDELKHIPDNARKLLTNKLSNVVTRNGLSGSATNPRFVITANADILTKDITPTAPPKTAITLNITVYIADVVAQTVFASTMLEVKGVGDNETKAYTSAINRVAPQNPQLKALLEEGKTKIIEYYNSKCDVIISSAQALAGQKQYDEALATLFNVPDVSRECYDKCMRISLDIYQEYANQQCNQHLSVARAAWAGKELSKVEEHLGKITPDMGCYDEAQQLVATITSAVEAEGGSAWNFKMKRYDDSVDIEKMKIQAGKEVARSWASHGASKNFDWSWLFPGCKPKTQEQPKAAEPQKAAEKPKEPQKATAAPSGQAKQHEPLGNTTVLNKLHATVTAYHGDFKGNFTVLTDGEYSGTNCVVSWSSDATFFIIDLGSVKQINGITVGAVANRDVYLDWSIDGTNYAKLTHVLGSWGQSSSMFSIEIYTTDPSSENYEPRIQVKPVKARYLKLYSPKGSKVSEIVPLGL